MARRDVLVLCYHGVAPGPLHGEVTPEALRSQLSLLAGHGYRWTTFTEAVLGSEPERVAAITFDDGIASAAEHGLPILDDFGAPGTMFLTVEMLGWGGRVDADGAARLAERGWEIGSHTMTHPVLTNVGDETLQAELRESKRELEGLSAGRAPPSRIRPDAATRASSRRRKPPATSPAPRSRVRPLSHPGRLRGRASAYAATTACGCSG